MSNVVAKKKEEYIAKVGFPDAKPTTRSYSACTETADDSGCSDSRSDNCENPALKLLGCRHSWSAYLKRKRRSSLSMGGVLHTKTEP